jgi:acetylornithine/succinyldiaminopimelate/putrescine aminotransferase
MRNSFHGRTLAMISATGQEKVQKGFEPLVDGFDYANFNDIESVRAKITKKTCAIMLEPVQGEGGILPATKEFLQALRAECDKHNLLLIFDEIQCGVGRCGKLYAYEISGVVPDILTSAKALGNGMPIGAMLTTDEIAKVLEPGTHGTTFGGNPLACAAALAVLETMVSEKIPARSAEMGDFFRGELKKHLDKLDTVKEIRGVGLMTGIVLSHPGADIVKACAAKGLLINCTMGNILRILPPLVVSKEDCSTAARIIGVALAAEAAIIETARLSEPKLTGATA